MRLNFKNVTSSMLATILLLVFLEIFSTAFLPALGILNYQIPVNVILILFLCFKLETPYLPVLILIIQMFHSVFSIEGWAFGTFAGIIVSLAIGYVKELLDFSSALTTMILTQVFQLVWFVIIAILIYLKTGDFSSITQRFFHFLPESLFMSLLSPFFFSLLNKIWRVDKIDQFGAEA